MDYYIGVLNAIGGLVRKVFLVGEDFWHLSDYTNHNTYRAAGSLGWLNCHLLCGGFPDESLHSLRESLQTQEYFYS